MNLNKVILIGRISQQPSLFQSRSGINYCRFNIAITRDTLSSNSNNDITDFIPLVAFGNNATFIERYFNKGDLINVVGSIQMSQYTTKNGDVVSSASILIDQIKSLEPQSITQQRVNKNNVNTTIDQPQIQNQGNINEPTFKEEKQEENDNPWELDL